MYMEERRGHKRVLVDRAIKITLSNGSSVTAKMINISEKGISILYGASADIGAVLNFTFTLPVKSDLHEIKTKGVVIHSHFKGTNCCIGIEFQELSDENADLINSFIQYRTKS